jgi:hypothetical protein
MGYNRSGNRRKARLKRQRKEEARLAARSAPPGEARPPRKRRSLTKAVAGLAKATVQAVGSLLPGGDKGKDKPG